MESTHYITWNTKCCLYFLKLCKILCTFGQKLEGKREQRKTEWDHGWVKFPCTLISINLLFKNHTFREAYLDVLWKNCLPGALLSYFLSFRVDGSQAEPSAIYGLCQEGLILFPKWSHAWAQELGPHPFSPNLQSQTRCLRFPPLLAGREQVWNIKVQSERLGREGSSDFALSFLWGSPLGVSAWFTKKPFTARP